MSEDDQYDLFCTHCGQRITKDTAFCPSCGAQVSEMMEAPAGYGSSPAVNTSALESSLKTISIIMVISAVLLLAMGIYYLATVDAQINQLTSSSFWSSIVDAYADLGYTEDQIIEMMKTSLIASGAVYTITGVCLAIASACGFTKKMYTVGLICCIIATVLSITSIIGLIIGIIVTIKYSKTKPVFA